MTIHDTWVFLKTPSPYDSIKYLFPQGFPMRDPFPTAKGRDIDGSPVALWIIDHSRLDDKQYNALVYLIADHFNSSIAEVSNEATRRGGFAINDKWMDRMEVGAEGYARSMELKAFVESDHTRSVERFKEFLADQLERWVNGNTEPPPLPTSIDEVDPNLRTPELMRAIERNRVNQILASRNYSVFDVLMGNAMVDVLNELDPDHNYDLARWDDEDQDY